MKSFPRMALALALCIWLCSHAVAQKLQSSPGSHDYGQVPVGTTTQYIFQLTNTGWRALTISSKQKTGRDFSFSRFKLPITLQPGAGVQMRINFAPSSVGAIAGSLTLNSNARNPTLTVSVSGTGVASQSGTLAVSPASLSFGNVTVGASASLTLTLSAANGSVTISSAATNSAEFNLTGLSLPKTIAAGQSVTATVVFTPNASGTATATLALISDATNSPNTVALTGVGVPVNAHSADLSWIASQDVVVGYNIERSGTKGGPYVKINSVLDASTDYTDSTVSAGTTYYYVATAVDANGVESGYSNEVKVLIPTP